MLSQLQRRAHGPGERDRAAAERHEVQWCCSRPMSFWQKAQFSVTAVRIAFRQVAVVTLVTLVTLVSSQAAGEEMVSATGPETHCRHKGLWAIEWLMMVRLTIVTIVLDDFWGEFSGVNMKWHFIIQTHHLALSAVCNSAWDIACTL